MNLLLSLLLCTSLAFAQSPSALDADGDGLLDREEDKNQNGIVDDGETDPYNADTDGGGEADGAELNEQRDPLNSADDAAADPDTDGLINRDETQLGTDPSQPDSDGDGLSDAADPFPLDPEWKQDRDQDRLPDELEDQYGLSSQLKSDALADLDGDGLNNLDEFIEGTLLNVPDTDQDGVSDGDEVAAGTSPLENPCLEYVGGGQYFPDIQTHWAQAWVQPLHQTKVLPSGRRIVDGYQPAEGSAAVFLPDRNITRYELLKIALLTSCTPLLSDTQGTTIAGLAEGSFTDVSKRPRPHESPERKQRRQLIYTAVSRSIINGYADGTFRPDQPINRAEAVKIMLLASRLEPLLEPYAELTFSDVSDVDWFAPYVKQLADYGMVEGFKGSGSLLFKPSQNITRAEASKILLLLTITNPYVNGYVIPVPSS